MAAVPGHFGFGGVFDAAQGWDVDSRRVLDAALSALVTVCYSSTLVKELELGPGRVRQLLRAYPRMHVRKSS